MTTFAFTADVVVAAIYSSCFSLERFPIFDVWTHFLVECVKRGRMFISGGDRVVVHLNIQWLKLLVAWSGGRWRWRWWCYIWMVICIFYCTFIEVQESMIVCWLFPPMHSCILVCICPHVCTCIFYVLVLAFGCTLLPKSRQQNKKERMYADVCHWFYCLVDITMVCYCNNSG